MMQIQSILNPARTFCDVPGSSKKRVLENISNFICQDINNIESDELFAALLAREKLGSTGLGNGIAIPHCRIKNCSHTVGALIKLQHSIEYDALDNQPIDLLFVLLVPEQATDQHLQTLAMLAELFSQNEFREKLRNAQTNDELYKAAINFQLAA